VSEISTIKPTLEVVVRRYKADPDRCPFCGCDQIEGGFIEVMGRDAQQEVHCTECNAAWTEVYRKRGARFRPEYVRSRGIA